MKKLQKILVPLDFSKHSEGMVESSIFLADKVGAELVLCYVEQKFAEYSGFSVPNIGIEELEQKYLEAATTTLNGYVAQVEGRGVKCSGKILAGIIDEAIIKCAREEEVDLIIIGTHGYSNVERFFMGSVAMKVLNSAPCPVLKLNPYS